LHTEKSWAYTDQAEENVRVTLIDSEYEFEELDGINSLNECQKEEAEVIYLKNENDVKYYLSKS